MTDDTRARLTSELLQAALRVRQVADDDELRSALNEVRSQANRLEKTIVEIEPIGDRLVVEATRLRAAIERRRTDVARARLQGLLGVAHAVEADLYQPERAAQ